MKAIVVFFVPDVDYWILFNCVDEHFWSLFTSTSPVDFFLRDFIFEKTLFEKLQY